MTTLIELDPKWDPGPRHINFLCPKCRTGRVIALLDEVERLREGHEIVARIWKILGSPTFEELRGDTIYDVIEKRLSCATRAEAHAERLAGALEETLAAVESHRRNVLGATQSEYAASDDRLLVARSEARQALSSYRSEKDEACSRPADALDAPVQPTSSHLGNGVDQ